MRIVLVMICDCTGPKTNVYKQGEGDNVTEGFREDVCSR